MPDLSLALWQLEKDSATDFESGRAVVTDASFGPDQTKMPVLY